MSRVAASGYVLTIDLVEERADMVERHPCRIVECPIRFAEAPSQPQSQASPQAVVHSGYTGMGDNVEQWRSLVAAYFPADQVNLALAVMNCESGGNPGAYNTAYGASGLMQVLRSWADNFGYTPQQLFDPSINLHVASILYYDGGWRHWNASRHCWG